MKRGILCDPFQCKPEMAFFYVIFLFQITYMGVLYEWDFSNYVYGGTLWVRLDMEISKSAVLLANEHQSDQKKCYNWFSYTFSLRYRSRKNDCVIGMPENVASKRILTKMAASVFHRILSYIKYFAVINHQYMDIYHTKKQTENIPRSCSYLLL